MTAQIRPVSGSDWRSIADIFNYFVEHSFAAYFDRPVDESFWRDRYDAAPTYPFVVADVDGKAVGFAFLAPYHPASTMRHSGVVTYFIHPDSTGQGIGTEFLRYLLDAGDRLGVTNFFAHISSENPGSIRFHHRHGFTECGRFENVGMKNGESFDMVWMQKQTE